MALSCCLVPLALAADDTVPDTKILESNNAIIGDIDIEIGDVFDLSNPKEDNFLFRLANFLHYKTRHYIMADQLLFKQGDVYSQQLVDESERTIRANDYIYEANVNPSHYDEEDNTVDIKVKTRDSWTLSAGFNFSRSGSENKSSVFLEDSNFLGFGTEINFRRSSDVNRDENTFNYRNKNVSGRHINLGLDFSNNTDGVYKGIEITRPFYAFDVTRAYSFTSIVDDRTEVLFTDVVETDRYQHKKSITEASVGFSRGLIRNRTLRWSFGASAKEDRFGLIPYATVSNPLPPNTTFQYPWIDIGYLQNQYLKMTKFEHIKRIEDVNIGRDVAVRLGWSAKKWGSDRDSLIFQARFSDTFNVQANDLFLWSVSSSGRSNVGDLQNFTFNTNFRYRKPNFTNHALFTEFNFDLVHALDENTQLLLGGETGIRGYPNRIQSGDRRMNLTVEQRFYTDWHILQLLHAGGLLFFDAGSAWDVGNDQQNIDILSDVGFGLRLAASRSGSGKVFHLDFAFPLNPHATKDKFQFSVFSTGKF